MIVKLSGSHDGEIVNKIERVRYAQILQYMLSEELSAFSNYRSYDCINSNIRFLRIIK